MRKRNLPLNFIHTYGNYFYKISFAQGLEP
jgi:hypothetical protein